MVHRLIRGKKNFFVNLRTPAIFNLGVSASKFAETNKASNSNQLLKYFSKKSKSEVEEKENPNEISETSMSEPSSLNTSLEKLNSDEFENYTEISEKPTTSKMANSEHEVQVLENDEHNLIQNEVEVKKKVDDVKNKLDFFGQFKNVEETKFDDVDFVKCEKCGKKVLCWEMPEHEDFHFAKELARQLDPVSVEGGKKRSLEETHKSDENSKGQNSLLNVKSKKIKTNSDSNNKNSKSIENYFKKLN